MRPSVEGRTSWSESIMVVYLAEDLRTAISYRICRFPDLDDTWVWCNVVADGEMYAYTDQYLRCAARRNEPGAEVAVYEAPSARARITRLGPSAHLKSVSFSIDVGGHRGTDAREGAGQTPIALEGVFHPTAMHSPMAPGRYERLGRIEAKLRVAGKTHVIAGVSKQHEQTQTAPRFSKSFTYCELWNGHASLLALLTEGGSSGDFEVGDNSRKVTRFSITAPAHERHFGLTLQDGGTLQGEAQAAVSFGIPIYDLTWRGSFVSGTVGGQKMVGTLNDWKHQDQPYAPGMGPRR
jgi:hypothetical protein